MTAATSGGADRTFLRTINRGAVLEHLRRHNPSSRTEVAEATGLAKPTVSQIIEELVEQGLVHEVGLGGTSDVGGRPRILLRFNSLSSYLVGVHVGVRTTSVAVADALGGQLAIRDVPTPRGGARQAVREIAELITATLDDAGADPRKVVAGAACVPGLVSADGRMLLFAPNLGWRDVPLADMLTAATDVSFSLYNGAQATLVAEVEEGAAMGEKDVVLIYVGTGIGAAAYCDGVLIKGRRGLAGEIGHCQIDPRGALCNCGNRGCLETVAGAQAIVDTVAKRRRRATALPTVLDVVTAVEEGDTTAASVLADAAGTLGRAASWLVNVFDPAVLVLAGGLSGAGRPFLVPFQEGLDSGVMPSGGPEVRVETSTLGQNAEVRGVLLLAQSRGASRVRVVAG